MAARSYLVIGGGIVGVASALRLKAAGFAVTLIDPGDPRRGASFGNIGCIATEQAEPLASLHTLMTFPTQLFAMGGPVAFRAADARLWIPWSLKFLRACTPFRFAQGALALDSLLREAMPAWERMSTLAGIPPLVRPCGHYVVWMSAEKGAHGMETWKRAATGGARFRPMNVDELARVGAVTNTPPAAGIVFTGTGQVSEPQAAREALLAAFTARGGEVVQGSVHDVVTNLNEISALLDSGDILRAEAAVITAGAWSRPIMQGLGIDVPLIGERGYSVQSSTHKWPADLPPVVFEERALVLSRFSSGLRASSFVEFGDPNAPPDERKWERIAQHLGELGIAFSQTPDRWMGPRPTLPDYLPAIGRMEAHPRVLYAFGHQHLGMTMASVTAELIESLATWSPPRINLAPFRVERFA